MRALITMLAGCSADPFVFVPIPGDATEGTEVLAVERRGQVSVFAAALAPVIRFPIDVDAREPARMEAALYAEPIDRLPFPEGPIAPRSGGDPLPVPSAAFTLDLEDGAWRAAAWPPPLLSGVRVDPGCHAFGIVSMDSVGPTERILDAVPFGPSSALVAVFDDGALENRLSIADEDGIRPVDTATVPRQQIRTIAIADDVWVGEAAGALFRSDLALPLDFAIKHQLAMDDPILDLAVAPVDEALEVFVLSRRSLSKFVTFLETLHVLAPDDTDRRAVVRTGADRAVAISGTELLRYDGGTVRVEALSSVIRGAASASGTVIAVTEAGEILALEPAVEPIRAATGIAIETVLPYGAGFLIGDSGGVLTEFRSRSTECPAVPVFGDDVIKRIVPIGDRLLLFGRDRIAVVK